MRKVGKIGSWLFSVGVLVALLVAFGQRQEIYDWWRLRGYEPPARIAALADATTMTDEGRKLFYVHRPELNNAAQFNANCQGIEQSIILGCHVSRTGIYVFDVEDERLAGVEEVTAAHEMLHAAYDRLSPDEKQRIDTMTQSAFDGLDNERIKTTVAAYEKRDASVVPNELHSILGTEVRELPAELETYYQRYFDDRVKVVSFSEQYEQAFTARKNKVANYDVQLARLREQITSAERQLDALSQAVGAERDRLDALLANDQTEQYNAAVPHFNAQIRQYNSLLAETRRQIDQFNEIVAARNNVAIEQRELIEALDSHLVPQDQE